MKSQKNLTISGKLDDEEEDDNNDAEELTHKTINEQEKSLQESEQKLKREIKINYACLCLFAFLLGADFAVIIPTLWDRLSVDYGASGTFMGLVMSSYSLTGVVFGLLLGKLSDSVNKTKYFYLICMTFSILGHMLYFVGINKYGILAARSISGLGLGASPVALAYIAKTTNEKQRISVLACIMGSRQIGLMFGPAFNIFLRKTNFYLFDTFLVDRKSSPGLLMVLLWSLCFLLVVFVYKDSCLNKRNKNELIKVLILTKVLIYFIAQKIMGL